jgi:chromosome segregation ATPase
MTYAYILLSTFREDLPVGLALCIAPFLLGWLFSFVFHRVSALQQQVKDLGEDKARLEKRVQGLEGDLTDTRVRLTQAESEIHGLREQASKLKNELIIAESERNILKAQLEEGKKK